MISNFGLQASAGFDPRQIPGLVGWWDAAAVAGFGTIQPTFDTQLVTWQDLSGSARHLTVPDTYQGGRYRNDGIYFGPSTTYRMSTTLVPALSSATVVHAYTVHAEPTGFASLLSLGSGDTRFTHQTNDSGTHNRVRWDKLSNANLTLTGSEKTIDTPTIVTVRTEFGIEGGGRYSMRTNGYHSAGSSFTEAAATSFTGVITRYGNSSCINTSHVVMLFNGYMDTNDCLRIEQWLGKRFGVAVA